MSDNMKVLVKSKINNEFFELNKYYLAEKNQSENGLKFDYDNGLFFHLNSKEQIDECFEVVEIGIPVEYNIKDILIFNHYVNVEFEEEEALFDVMLNKVVMIGDYYHEKIPYKINGFLDGLAYSGKYIILNKERIDKDNLMFEKIGFYKIEDNEELECIINNLESGDYENCSICEV